MYICLLSCIDKTAACVMLRKQQDMYAFLFFLRKYQLYIHFQHKY